MDALLHHHTLLFVAGGFVVGILYLFIYPKVYPYLVARSLADRDGGRPEPDDLEPVQTRANPRVGRELQHRNEDSKPPALVRPKATCSELKKIA